MLTQETKRKIDSVRQILVGKVPDPKAQVEQITTALIYKFMDDMDKESQELGGKARFFTNGYEKYAWTKLMDSRIGGQDRLNLYVEAITTLSQNPHLPQLFRDIFKDAFLPYRDPETLNLFLKEINGFIYEHSEDLGDAFEYLLSILGSQGEAGQFRTPRHIIDFIVAAVDPKKDETICDPACGTAGFLISAFKHILKENKEKSLTPDERKNLMDHFVGYDISPDMVRLSKVNLYLHGFPNPTIFEYDTLSSEEKWDENFDVMLANPPFMSPTGGIRPHKRFSVHANRSEVLFVDYILEHLRPNGRAGIIVPEGIIFQSATAYKALRKLLIEDGLLAVVSLPQGVFIKPGGKGNVKTRILIFDKVLAKKTNEILFIKINNDGFDLGVQRRPIDKNDLPLALEIIKEYKVSLKENKKFKLDEKQSKIAYLVAKEKIAENGDYNLSGDRYREVVNFANQKWPMVELGEVCEIFNGSRPKGGAINKGILSIGGEHINYDGSFNLEKRRYIPKDFFNKLKRGKLEVGDVLIVKDGATTGKVGYFNDKSPFKIAAVNEHVFILRVNKEKIDSFFLYQFLKSPKGNTEILKHKVGAAQGGINLSIKKIKIPLPPIEVQKEIVEQIEVKQKAIEAAKAVIDNLEKERRYFGQKIRKIKDVEWVELGEVLEYEQPTKYIVKSVNYSDEYKTPVLTAGQTFILGYTNEKENIFPVEKLPVIIFDDFTTATKFVDFPFKVKSSAMKILHTKREKADTKFLFYAMQDIKFNHDTHKRYWISEYSKIKIPLPPLEVQKQLVAEMEEQEKIIEANKKLIGIMEQKITEILSEI